MFPTKTTTTTSVAVSAPQNLLPVAAEATASKAAQATPATNFKFPTPATNFKFPTPPAQQQQAQKQQAPGKTSKTKKATKKSSTPKPKSSIENSQKRRGPEEYQRPSILKRVLRINQDEQLLG
jgi:hypothetical protein